MFRLPLSPPLDISPLGFAKWHEDNFPKSLGVDETWLLRDYYQDMKNRERAKDWATRFKILRGPSYTFKRRGF